MHRTATAVVILGVAVASFVLGHATAGRSDIHFAGVVQPSGNSISGLWIVTKDGDVVGASAGRLISFGNVSDAQDQ